MNTEEQARKMALRKQITQLEADKAELVAALRNVSIFGKLHCDTCKQMVATLVAKHGKRE